VSTVPTTLRIPDSDLPGVRLIRDLPADVFAALVVAIEHSPAGVPSVTGIAPADAEQIMEALDSMYRFKIYADVRVEEFVSDVCEALREVKELDARNERTLRDRLTRLLDIEALNIAAKAALLHLEHEHRFCTARIVTDARPVYGTDVEASPSAMVIGHTLKISYHEGDDVKDIYIALRSSNLGELRKLIDRAEKKEKSLRAALQPTQIRLIDRSARRRS
jgi:hypothetical protein